jgi:hypothetical protein
MVDVELNIYKEVIHDHLEKFGVDGFQTLCFAYHELNVQLYEAWNKLYEAWNKKFIQAQLALQNMEKKLDEVNNFSQEVLIIFHTHLFSLIFFSHL